MELKLPELYNPNELIAEAVKAYLNTREEQLIQVWLNGQKEAPYLASYFVRGLDAMPELEKTALQRTTGKTLDIGAGAGPHSKVLLEKGLEVHSLELNDSHCKAIQNLPNSFVINQDFFEWKTNEKYDTLLLLMNGFGICQNEPNLKVMLQKLKSLLTADGQILAEITDYNYSDFYDHEIKENSTATFRLKYLNQFSYEFNWFYPKLDTLKIFCQELNLNTELIFQEEEMLLLRITAQD